jgi:hypothetical protein
MIDFTRVKAMAKEFCCPVSSLVALGRIAPQLPGDVSAQRRHGPQGSQAQ